MRQSEVWLVNFFPKVGSEISKERPAIVVSHDEIGRLPLKIIVPVTDWKPNYAHYPWMVRVENSEGNGLSKVSAIDCFQVKNFANQRFVKKLGSINDGILKIVHSTVAKALNPAYVLEI
ncbi:MAG: type II toxin-antitoxin system PemK/MazF family toxin [Deltaproteobacteria bacterium]|nr:type II toxin-antitoxin system PemK/MazF family toxin [Deltaproteobacteria bacterium]